MAREEKGTTNSAPEHGLHADHSGFSCSGVHVMLVSQSTSNSRMSGSQSVFPQSRVSEVTVVIVFLPTPQFAEHFDSDIWNWPVKKMVFG